MQYLFLSLEGRARATVAEFDITDDNFSIAWKALCNKYENELVVTTGLINRLLDISVIRHDKLDTLLQFDERIKQTLATLKKMGYPVDEWDALLVCIVTRKFDDVLTKEWRLTHGSSRKYPKLSEVDAFIDTYTNSLLCATVNKSTLNPSKSGEKPREKSTVHFADETRDEKKHLMCPLCRQNHQLIVCPVFRELPPVARLEFVKSRKMCINCFAFRHTVTKCNNDPSCRDCDAKHNTLLHLGTRFGNALGPNMQSVHTPKRINQSLQSLSSPSTSKESETPVVTEPSPSVSTLTAGNVTSQTNEASDGVSSAVLLATAFIRVYAPNGRYIFARALLDQGSQSSFVTSRIARQLRLPRVGASVTVQGAGGGTTSTVEHRAQVTFGHFDGRKPLFSTNALILKAITQYIPPPVKVKDFRNLKKLMLAEPNPASDRRIDVLIGADMFGRLLRPGLLNTRGVSLAAQNTAFGWILSGPVIGGEIITPRVQVNICTLESLDRNVRRFWESEAIPEAPSLTESEKQCEKIFVETYTRDISGRFTVRLPFNRTDPAEALGDSYRGAISALNRLSRKFLIDEGLRREYKDFLDEYSTLGHMSRIETLDRSRVFIPHRTVLSADSLTTKLRVVFNASNVTSSGLSLNDVLHVGPRLQLDITSILLNWRLYEYVLVADIEKMFRQILVHEEDRKFQCILWREEDTENLVAYQLNTVTYGTACAPYLSMRVIKELNFLEGADYPLAIPVLQNSIYVDDVFLGAPDRTLLEHTRLQVTFVLQRGGFPLRKWAGNDKEILTNIPVQKHSHAVDLNLFDESEMKVLGIRWLPSDDSFRFDLRSLKPAAYPLSKRALFSEIAKLFDPLGWLSPVIVRAKILMQEQWLAKISWDDVVSEDTYKRWSAFCLEWSILKEWKIPRWVMYGADSLQIELHGFCDASISAYSCAVYLRVRGIDGATHVSLLMAKSRVAPSKTLSIPVLELNGAVLLTELISHVKRSLSVQVEREVCWTDSNIVLAWLKKHPSTWKIIVANRVSKIQTSLPNAEWRHVSTRDNPADMNSRGVDVNELVRSTLWLSGPHWLLLEENQWPKKKEQIDTSEGLRVVTTHATQSAEYWEVFTKFSSWNRLVRVISVLYRFKKLAHSRVTPKCSTITVEDTRDAVNAIARYHQMRAFPDEYRSVKNGSAISPKSSIAALSPFLDEHGVMRVGGRLKYSFLKWETKHPIILPKGSVSELIVRQTHRDTLHGGIQLTMQTVRQMYWIIGLRNITKTVVHRCINCIRWRASLSRQLMSDLVPDRCRPSRAFEKVGVDYAGPYLVREAAGRGKKAHKTYIAVFVCSATRAIHIELVHDYSAAAFIAAFERFVARRGLPSKIHSDNGTNFVGADRELKRNFDAVYTSGEMQDKCIELSVEWQFNPPSAPHFGGMQEAGVKSIKHHLRRVLGNFTPTTEEMTTLLCNIEAMLNSRPLSRLNDDAESLEVLTPGHFLTGAPLNALPQPSVEELRECTLSRWQTMQRFREQIWKVWTREHLQDLQRRNKWATTYSQIRVDDLVLVLNPLLPPNRWELGRITKVLPGGDGNVRVVEVKTPTSTYTRPITRVCKLPINTN